MINRRLISAAVALVGSAVGLVLSAAHTKKDLVDIRQKKWEELTRQRESRKEKINTGVEECRNTPGGVLLDVREKADYEEGHIPGAILILRCTDTSTDLSNVTVSGGGTLQSKTSFNVIFIAFDVDT